MSELDKTKYQAIRTLMHLCGRCQEGAAHSCRIQELISEIESIQGIPIIVNSELRHVVLAR
ncbi:MAG: hypothetical protein HY398_02615 [Candidatus Doudnabacteria bacterium]|nr:hypothetical protein [Candidatus Doudnabacteria bacterium]